MNIPDFNIVNSLFVPSDGHPDQTFEENYVVCRTRENRMYSDEETAKLPNIQAGHPHQKEWTIRKQSCQNLIDYLESKGAMLHILEVGCGNGWLSHELSGISGCRVIGIDINLTELHQAARVFNRNSKLKFVYGDIRSDLLKDLKFDAIIFAASIQYFPDLKDIIQAALHQLNPGGEIHITDSHLYKSTQVDAAAKRTNDYYLSLGFPQMTHYYFHHCLDGLADFKYQIMRNPHSVKSRLFGNKNPFYWICIKNEPFSN
jgi:ubiquinone/menaquinone biosynthesis C-methylase UbiE